ncbi:MAG TPA: hypothetical protein VGK48_08130 [Terriglobia bacterium]|jgi:lipopolysaccharide assembly outer membrane protein LptD (OstA)
MAARTLSALSIERDVSSGLTHLKGGVELKIASGQQYTILRADEVIYDPNTGDIQPMGNISLCMAGGIAPCF